MASTNKIGFSLKIFFILIIAILVSDNSFAQSMPRTKSPRPASEPSVAVPIVAQAAPAPTGPFGIGPLKMGMTREAVEALGPTDGVWLAQPLIQETPTVNLPENEYQFKAQLTTPLDPNINDGTFFFIDDKLTALTVNLTPQAFERVRAEITQKYGPGIPKTDNTEEQCVYHNGANFKVTSGTVSNKWSLVVSPVDTIQTSLMQYTINRCPYSLQDNETTEFISRWISFSDLRKVDAKPSNLF